MSDLESGPVATVAESVDDMVGIGVAVEAASFAFVFVQADTQTIATQRRRRAARNFQTPPFLQTPVATMLSDFAASLEQMAQICQ